MKLVKIIPIDEKAGSSVFFLPDFGSICVETKDLGFFEHPNINTDTKLEQHLKKMRSDGCLVLEEEFNPLRKVSYERLCKLFSKYVSNDADAAGIHYAYEMLKDIGCTKEEADELCLGWVYEFEGERDE